MAAAYKHSDTEENNNTREKGKISVLFTIWICSLLSFKPKSDQKKFLAAGHKHADTEEKNNTRENNKIPVLFTFWFCSLMGFKPKVKQTKFCLQHTNMPTQKKE